eukprot:TRINITY_DN21208_c0_g1_i1.p1 TRINITY_DN21208_c0_g1~~TRINITY_DN21208_c0_g1_i1.p1  ORF type:complete len:128 (-),score=11.40 TRINITY_DN21208_c0_g1_i1:163-546(-)
MANRGKQRLKNRDGGYVFGIIGDEDTVTGFLLSGVGDVDTKREKNFFVVTAKTKQSEIEHAFRFLTSKDGIAILLITQAVADQIRHIVRDYDKLIPTILEIPSKDSPYDPEKDSVMTRVRKMTGTSS